MTKRSKQYKDFDSLAALSRDIDMAKGTMYYRAHKYGIDSPLVSYDSNLNSVCSRDHEGRNFPSITAMCRYWKIPLNIFYARVYRSGWTIQKALTSPVRSRGPYKPRAGAVKYTDKATGRTFKTDREYAEFLGITIDCLRNRVKNVAPGLLTFSGPLNKTPSRDHEGRDFPSITEMCRHWKIPLGTFLQRRRNEWDLKRALTEPPKTRRKHDS